MPKEIELKPDAGELTEVVNLPLFWQGVANAFRLMDNSRTQSDAGTLGQADAYEQCSRELRTALVLASAPDSEVEREVDPTAQTEPLTTGQRIVADYERDMIAEPCELAAAIDAELSRVTKERDEAVAALEQIKTCCTDNAADTVRHDLALKFVGDVADKAYRRLATPPSAPLSERKEGE